MAGIDDAPPPTPRTSPATTWLLVAAFGVLTLVTSAQGYIARRASNEPAPLSAVMGVAAAAWVSWLGLAPLVIALGRRVPFTRTTWARAAFVHAIAMTGCYIVSVLVLIGVSTLALSPTEPVTRELVTRTLLTSSRLSLAIFMYATILAVDHVLRAHETLRWRELQATRLAQQATQSRLDALAARLEPHFLFNTLQSVSALVDVDPARARTMLAQLGDLLRDALDVPDAGDVTVAGEFQLLRRYLAIEETRFADRLRVEYALAPEVATRRVPRFLLQPIAENALRHGLAPLPGGGRLHLRADSHDGRLRLSVWNSGMPLPAHVREGVGLRTTRERLATRYGDRASLHLRAADGGVETIIEVPE